MVDEKQINQHCSCVDIDMKIISEYQRYSTLTNSEIGNVEPGQPSCTRQTSGNMNCSAENVTCSATFLFQIKASLLHVDTKELVTEEEYIRQQQSRHSSHSIVFVIDTSLSMSKVMPMVRKVMQQVIKVVRGESIGIVTFNTETQVICPLGTLVNETQKQSLHRRMKKIKAEGCTNLCQGLVDGINLFNEKKCSNDGKKFMILLTDGKPNIGLTESDDIINTLDNLPLTASTDIYCMALGEQVNGQLLEILTSRYRGRLYALQNSNDIPCAFGDCMGSVMSALTSGCTLTVYSFSPLFTETNNARCDQGVDGVYKISIPIGTLFFGDQRDILIDFQIKDVAEEFPIGRAQLSYMIENDVHTIEKHVMMPLLPFPSLNIVESNVSRMQSGGSILKNISRNIDDNKNADLSLLIASGIADHRVTAQRYRLNVSKCLNRIAETSLFTEKQERVKDLIRMAKELQEFSWFEEDILCQELVQTINDYVSHFGIMSEVQTRSLSTGLATQRQVSRPIHHTHHHHHHESHHSSITVLPKTTATTSFSAHHHHHHPSSPAYQHHPPPGINTPITTTPTTTTTTTPATTTTTTTTTPTTITTTPTTITPTTITTTTTTTPIYNPLYANAIQRAYSRTFDTEIVHDGDDDKDCLDLLDEMQEKKENKMTTSHSAVVKEQNMPNNIPNLKPPPIGERCVGEVINVNQLWKIGDMNDNDPLSNNDTSELANFPKQISSNREVPGSLIGHDLHLREHSSPTQQSQPNINASALFSTPFPLSSVSDPVFNHLSATEFFSANSPQHYLSCVSPSDPVFIPSNNTLIHKKNM